jgi:hypothetical protein
VGDQIGRIFVYILSDCFEQLLFEKVSRMFVLPYSTVMVKHYFWQKKINRFGYFCADFLQTHLVALVGRAAESKIIFGFTQTPSPVERSLNAVRTVSP